MPESKQNMSPKLPFAMIGDGRMGQRISELSAGLGFECRLLLGRENNANASGITEERFSGIEAAIDFSHADVVLSHAEAVLKTGTPLVIGTTGWLGEQQQAAMASLIKTYDGRVVYGSNFSLGVQLFMKLAREAGRLMGHAEGFDAALHEVHHTRKADAPSGTAITLAKQFLAGAGKPEKTRYGVPERGTADTDAFRISSQRLGDVFGEHQLRINSEWDDIELTHRARSRDGFAAGALKTARWLVNQPAGFYFVEDEVGAILAS
ncbi:MAG: 4-hydroxy-tetrahydrodipicolinate reductase [Cyclonatronaceae bacterium]